MINKHAISVNQPKISERHNIIFPIKARRFQVVFRASGLNLPFYIVVLMSCQISHFDLVHGRNMLSH